MQKIVKLYGNLLQELLGKNKVNSFTCTLYEQHLFQSVCLLRKCFFRIKDSFIGFQLLLKV